MNHHFFKTIMVGALAAAMILGAGCKKSPSVVNVSDISLSEESLELKIGETKQLEVSVLPENASDRTVVWGSDNDKIVTVSQEGLVTAMGSGKTVVTARTSDGSLWGTCKVRVITKVTALALYYPDDCIWGGADYDNIIKFTSTPSTAVAADFIWDVFDNKDIVTITLWEDHRAVSVRPLADGKCRLKVTPKDGYAGIARTLDFKVYKRRFAVIPNADGADFNGDGIEDGATIDMSKVKTHFGQPAIFIGANGFGGGALVEEFEIIVEDKGIVKVAEINKFPYSTMALCIQLPLGTGSGTAQMTIKNTMKAKDGSVLNTYTREFTLLVPESTTTE